MNNKIILDTDPGIDDAIAIIVLLSYLKDDVELILSTYGNISVEDTTRNALTILSLLNRDIPVVKGATHPSYTDNPKDYQDAANIHGDDGLFGLRVEKLISTAYEGDFLEKTYNTIIKHDKVDYITIGPLTNLALLMQRYPDVINHIENVITMGAGIDMGNVTPHAEFNIHCDAQSADYVFKNAKKLALIPLNTSTTVAFSLEQIAEIEKIGTTLAKAMANILTHNYHSCVAYGEPGSVMHDSTAILYYLFPELFNTKICGIDVDCGEFYGKTTINNDRNNITLTTDVQPQVLLEKIANCINQK